MPEAQPVEAVTQASVDTPNNKEARYRVERNEARADRDALVERIAQLHQREIERLAAKDLSNPSDIFTLSDKSMPDFVGEDGELDPELVQQAVDEILGTRPGLRVLQRPIDPSQGAGGAAPAPAPTWAGLFRS